MATKKTGLALPIIRSGGGYFARRSYRDVVWSNIIHILTTPYGTWPGRLDYGSRLTEMTFEQNDSVLINEFRYETEGAIKRYEDEVVAITATVEVDEHSIQTLMRLRLKNDTEAFERGFAVARNEAFKILEVF